MADFFRRIMEAEGFAVALANDFDAALQELQERFYPVTVIDLRLMGEHDYEGLRLIEETDRLWMGTVFKVLVSGFSLSPAMIQRITSLGKACSATFMPKGGEDGTGFDRSGFLSAIWSAFARFSQPVRCPLSTADCIKPVEPKMNQVFVAMPYELKTPGVVTNMNEVYRLGIRPTLRDLGYSILRADESPFVGALMCNVCQGIQESVLCIVDITDWNPNVLLELGLMYGLGKTTVILKHARSEVPTDLKFALYSEYDGIGSLKSGLRKVITGLRRQQL